MSLYDTSNPLQKEQFKARSAKLAESGKVVELTEKKPKKSTSQLKAKSAPVDLSASGEESENWPFLSYLGSHTRSPNAKTFNQ